MLRKQKAHGEEGQGTKKNEADLIELNVNEGHEARYNQNNHSELVQSHTFVTDQVAHKNQGQVREKKGHCGLI